MTNDGRKSSGEVTRSDMGGGKGGSKVSCCGVSGDGSWMMDVCVVSRDDRCLLSGGESMQGGVIFPFLLVKLVGIGPGGF